MVSPNAIRAGNFGVRQTLLYGANSDFARHWSEDRIVHFTVGGCLGLVKVVQREGFRDGAAANKTIGHYPYNNGCMSYAGLAISNCRSEMQQWKTDTGLSSTSDSGDTVCIGSQGA